MGRNVRIHMWKQGRDGGKARTACGHVVGEDQVTTDWRHVNCPSPGCYSAASEGRRRFEIMQSQGLARPVAKP